MTLAQELGDYMAPFHGPSNWPIRHQVCQQRLAPNHQDFFRVPGDEGEQRISSEDTPNELREGLVGYQSGCHQPQKHG